LRKNLLLSILSGLLLGFSWPTNGQCILIFFSLVPLLISIKRINNTNIKFKNIITFFISYVCFFLWNLITTWWIYNSTGFGAAFAILVNSSFYSFMMVVFRISLRLIPKTTSQILLLSMWISFEKFHLNWDFSWPWLNLGNVFSESIYFIQWYEYTGVFGGTLWILIINFFIFNFLENKLNYLTRNQIIYKTLILFFLLVIPIIISIFIYKSNNKKNNEVEVAILQPNIDPYSQKFKKRNSELFDLIENLSSEYISQNTKYLIAPEGYLDDGLGLDLKKINDFKLKSKIDEFLNKYKNLNLIVGAQSYKLYPKNTSSPSITANKLSDGRWLDVYNSALQFSYNQEPQFYHKSKLVVGVEFMPYKNLLEPLIGEVLLDFGGTIATRGIQDTRINFQSKEKVIAAPIICYESIYGSFVTEYVRRGAQLLVVISNDAWWGNTEGHRQLLSYSRLRSIENRRAIARSANTGISAIIDRNGQIIKKIEYDKKGVLIGNIELENKLTFYSKYGDYIARIALLLFILTSLFLIRNLITKK
jgi:apolipoprotein N-acyltransferase